MRDAGVTTAVRISPQHTQQFAPTVLAAGVDLLVIQGTIVSAEHVTTQGDALNLKEFIADLDVPVIVGGAANYQTALHLMRTGRSEEHTSELQSRQYLVCRLLLEKKQHYPLHFSYQRSNSTRF